MSAKLADGDFDGLRGLVAPEEIERVRKLVEGMNVSMREEMRVMKEDVMVDIPAEINLKQTDDEDGRKTIEILHVYITVRSFTELQKSMSAE